MSKTIALTYNLIKEEELHHKPIDTMAELDTFETIEAIQLAIENSGHKVILIEADENAYENFKKYRQEIDIVFNIAEGIRGESRESHIPCMLEMLNIPYIGSGPLTLAICLNKYRTKEILQYYNIPTAIHQIFHSFGPKLEDLDPRLEFPLIIKLSSEGSCIGVDYDNIVDNKNALLDKMAYLLNTYHQPVIVEKYLSGREFTIPIIGNQSPVTLPIIEILFFGQKPINVFVPDLPLKVFNELNYTPPEINTRPVCPAEINEELKNKLNHLALSAFKALECRDWCRIEIRLDHYNSPYILELNPIAGIAPGFWFPRSAEAAGLDYPAFINKLLDTALSRYKL